MDFDKLKDQVAGQVSEKVKEDVKQKLDEVKGSLLGSDGSSNQAAPSTDRKNMSQQQPGEENPAGSKTDIDRVKKEEDETPAKTAVAETGADEESGDEDRKEVA